MKICSICGRSESQVDFYPRHTDCKECIKLQLRLQYQANPEKFKQKSQERSKKLRKENNAKWREQTRAASKRYRIRYPGRIVQSQRLNRYGLTPAQFEAMEQEQNRQCKICGKAPKNPSRPWNVDHDHRTGKVRGLLCINCNSLLGMAKDSIQVLERAINYLKESNSE